MITRRTLQSRILLAATFATVSGCEGGDAIPDLTETQSAQASTVLLANNPGANHVTSGDPGAAFFNGRHYLSFIGQDNFGMNNLIMEAIEDVSPNNFGRYDILFAAPGGDRSNSGASLAVFNNLLYEVFVGTDGQVNVLSTADGLNFGNRRIFSGSKHGLPGLAVYQGHLWIVVHEYDDRAVLFWENGTYVGTLNNARSNDGFVIAELNGYLYLIWSSTKSNREINVQKYSPSTGWLPGRILTQGGNPSVTTIPAANGMPEALAMIMRCPSICGPSDTANAWISFDGVTWNRQALNEADGWTPDKPIAFEGYWNPTTVTLNIAFTGTDHQLNLIERWPGIN